MSIPILQGRALTHGDGEKSAPAIVVSASTARRYWPGENPIGKHVKLAWENRWRTVVGVAGDVRQFDLTGRSPDYIRGAMYMPYAQAEDNDRRLPAAMALVVRTSTEPAGIVGTVRDLVRQLNPNVPVDDIRSIVSLIEESTEQPRSMTWLFVSFAAVALVLAAVGTYGVVSYSMAQRTFELAVRVALGAGRRNIFGLVLGHSLSLAMSGLALGLTASLAMTRLIGAFLYSTSRNDPLTLAGVSSMMLAIALIAGFVPAWKAAGVDPLRALRTE